jgi:hypothetical protein
MSNDQKIEAAKQYVDKQLETMKKYGSAPQNLSDNERQALVEEIVSLIDAK